MKSRILSSEKAVFRKNITRFVPVWAIYSVFLLISLMTIRGNNNMNGLPHALADFSNFMCFVNGVYALVCALTLFGDLFNSRMCNAIHALPLRRESWFGVHALTGLCFSVVPNFVFALFMIPCGESMNWLWLVLSTLQFLLCFGTALLCIQLTGSRFAATVVYGLIHFGALLIFWLIESLYVPMLPGVEVHIDLVAILCPLVNYMQNIPVMSSFDMELDAYVIIYNSTGWINLSIMAAVGVAFGGLALLLYRRRQLECAGDFMAVKVLNPVFLAIYSLVVAALFHGMCELFLDGDTWVFLLLGLAVGYFTGQMLLSRTTRVFGIKYLRGLAVLVLCFLLSFVVTFLDPINITGWVPEADHVSAVMINNKEITDPALVEQVILFHEEVTKDYDGYDNHSDRQITLAYRMKSGRIVRRAYWIDIDSVAGELLRPVVSSPEYVLEGLYPDFDNTRKDFSIQILHDYHETIPRQHYQELMDCLILDCREGNLPQDWWEWNDVKDSAELRLMIDLNDYRHDYTYLEVTDRATHTVQWLKDHGYWHSAK